VLVNHPPAPIALSREAAKAPYSEKELAAYFSLAAHQPSEARRYRAQGLLCLGAGAGLIGADLRCVKGSDVVVRSGGLLVQERGVRPRVVPVLARYHDQLVGAARFAGSHYVVGGNDPHRHNVTTPSARLRSTWLVTMAASLGLRAFLDAAGVTCTQRLGDLVAALEAPSEREAVALLGRQC
jgi:hypothetical protein